MKTFYNVYGKSICVGINHLHQLTQCLAICAFAAIGGGLFGFDISSMSGVLGTPAYKKYFNYPSGYRQGGITAAMPAGSLFGALCSSFLADRLSRRTAIQIAALVWIVGE
jgi:MFS family permease|tara:strand:+ start:9304 stop:9633 length:330 start_codon:yes stop_codon:yes gene_type:complete